MSTLFNPGEINEPLMQWAWSQRTGGYKQKLVLVVLSALADEYGCVTISRAELAESTCIRGKRALQSAINALRHLGYLEFTGDCFCLIRPDEPPIEEGERLSLTISAELRCEIHERDGFACVACGATSDLQIDHIFPLSLGGFHNAENLQTLCGFCNQEKGDLTMAEWTKRRRRQ